MARLIVPPAGFIEPMLPTLVDTAPDGDAWVHEIKYDGYRTQLTIAGQDSRAFTRNGYDWTDKYGIVVAAAKALKCRSAVIDGEMCVQNADGVTDFKALRSAIGRSPEQLILFAFDILALDGRDLRGEPLLDRRRRLQDLVGMNPTSRVQFSAEQAGQGPAFFAAADQHGLEGIVSKRADSRYVSGRAKTWLKVKSFTVGEYAVLGVERSSTGIPVALLATLGRDPAYVGNAMVTLPAKERKAFWASVETMGTPQARLAGFGRNKKATWIREGLVARVRHLREETGLSAGRLTRLGDLWIAYGVMRQMHHVYLAEELTHGETDPDPEEHDLELHRVPVAEFESMLMDGRVMDSCSAAAWGMYRVWKDRQKL